MTSGGMSYLNERIIHFRNSNCLAAFLNLEAEGYNYPNCKTLVAFVTGDTATWVEKLTDEQVADEVSQIIINQSINQSIDQSIN